MKTIIRKNENILNRGTSNKPPNLISIITHKDGNDKTIADIKEPQNNNKMSSNVKQGMKHTSTDTQLRQDNEDNKNKDEYGCHIVTRNPKFLASISYPNLSQTMYNIRKPPINTTRKESRVRQTRAKDGTKMHPKKVLILNKTTTLVITCKIFIFFIVYKLLIVPISEISRSHIIFKH